MVTVSIGNQSWRYLEMSYFIWPHVSKNPVFSLMRLLSYISKLLITYCLKIEGLIENRYLNKFHKMPIDKVKVK